MGFHRPFAIGAPGEIRTPDPQVRRRKQLNVVKRYHLALIDAMALNLAHSDSFTGTGLLHQSPYCPADGAH
jgi:hypothetical protein